MKVFRLKGSYSVEAGVVVSMAMLLIMAMLFLGMLLSDRLTVYETALYYISELEQIEQTQGSVYEEGGNTHLGSDALSAAEVKARFLEKVNDRMLLLKIDGAEVAVDGRTMSITYRGAAEIRAGTLVNGLLARFLTVEKRVERKMRRSPQEFVRMCRGIIWRDQ